MLDLCHDAAGPLFLGCSGEASCLSGHCNGRVKLVCWLRQGNTAWRKNYVRVKCGWARPKKVGASQVAPPHPPPFFFKQNRKDILRFIEIKFLCINDNIICLADYDWHFSHSLAVDMLRWIGTERNRNAI